MAPSPALRLTAAEHLEAQRSRDSSAIADAIAVPGAVNIDVTGAFITPDHHHHHTAEADLGDGNGGGEDDGEVDADAAAAATDRSAHHSADIRLPHHTSVVSHVAVDIGGSLTKLVYFSRERRSSELGGRLNFLRFENDKIEQCFALLRRLKERYEEATGGRRGDLCVMATGGGAYKFYERMKEVLGVKILREDEMECLIIGLDFFITEIPGEVFSYSENEPVQFVEAHADIYPYLLVNIGSGVSMIKVSGPRKYERIGGTSLGGGTLWGLLSLLTGARTFDDMLALAEKGDNTNVDMLVKDIYGTDYAKIGLKSSLIASSFGKVFKMKRQAEDEAEDGGGLSNGDGNADEASPSAPRFAPEDIARSLLYAVSNNIGQIAYLQSEKHDLANIYFGGSFIRGHRQTMNTLSYAIRFWSKGSKTPYFLRHEGYLGAVGAFLKRQPKNWGRKNSFETLNQ